MLPLRCVWQRYCRASLTVLWELRDGLQFLNVAARSRTAVVAEVLFLRKQLAYYRDHQIRPRRLTDVARLLLVLGPGFSTGEKRSWSLHPVPSSAGIAMVSSCIGAGSQAADGQHFARMVRENITWGEERVADELSLKLGILVSPRTVRKYWPLQPDGTWHRRTSSQHWRTFVKNHAQDRRLRFSGCCDRPVPGAVRLSGHGSRQPPAQQT